MVFIAARSMWMFEERIAVAAAALLAGHAA
jgi:hypothetical protein